MASKLALGDSLRELSMASKLALEDSCSGKAELCRKLGMAENSE